MFLVTLSLTCLFAALLGATYGLTVDFFLSMMVRGRGYCLSKFDVLIFLVIEFSAVVLGLVGAKFFLWFLKLIGLVSENVKFPLWYSMQF